MKKLLSLVLFLPLLIVAALVGPTSLLGGCAGSGAYTAGDVVQVVSQNEVLFQAATKYATIKVVKKNPDLAPRVAQIASEAAAALTEGELVPVALLEREARAKINWAKLSPEETILVDALIITVRTELERAAQEVATPEEARVLAAQVLGWVAEAAVLGAPPPPPAK